MSDSERMRQTINNIANAIGEDDRQYSDAVSFPSVKHGSITVDIDEVTGMGGPGINLKSKTPNITVSINGNVAIMLTWDEARHFCNALKEVTDTAEYG